jgi:hypothetical protein
MKRAFDAALKTRPVLSWAVAPGGPDRLTVEYGRKTECQDGGNRLFSEGPRRHASTQSH